MEDKRIVLPGKGVSLRPYQTECLDRLHRSRAAGVNRMLVSLPTGTGKTVIFVRIPDHFGLDGRFLILAHREELLDQAAEKCQAANPSVSVGVEQAERRALDARIVVASVPSLRGNRLRAFRPEEFSAVVVDEAHHAVAPTYMAIFEHFGVLDPTSERMLVGFTATPRRGDHVSLGKVFEEITYSKGIDEMIKAGYLCQIRGWRVRTQVNLDRVKVRAGDFVEAQLARAVNTPERNQMIFTAWRKLAAGRRVLVFCADVAHSRDLARMFAEGGVRAAAIWGAMPREERRDILRRFHKGELELVTNCNVLTEGYDEPAVDCIIMARPTRSLLLYAQMLGRGTRIFPNKSDLIVIDVVDNCRKHTLAGLNAMFDLPENLDLDGARALDTAERLRNIADTRPWVDLSQVETAGDIEVVAERVDLFRLQPPPEIVGATGLAWLGAPGSGYRLPLPAGEFTVESTALGDCEVRYRDRATGLSTIVGRGAEPTEAVRMADGIVERDHPGALRLLRRDAAWRCLEATEKQIAVLRRHGMPTPPGLSRGQASWMLSYVLGPVADRSMQM